MFEVLKEVRGGEYYLCGANAMIEDMKNLLEERGVKKERILFEKYG